MAYTPGGHNTNRDHNFVSFYDMHEPDYDNKLYRRYGKQTLGGLMELAKATKGSKSIEYNHWEEKRFHRLIKATCSSGAAGAAVTFTTDSSAKISVTQASPYAGSVTSDTFNARANDIILIKPASGTTASWGNYIAAIILSVNKSAGTFSAQPLNSADAIPAISTADEIAIIGNAHGEGSAQPAAVSHSAEKFTNNMQIIKETHKITGTEKFQKLWFDTDESGRGGQKYFIKGEGETWVAFNNSCELQMMLGQKLSNTTLSNTFATAGTPLATTDGALTEINSKGVNRTYSAFSGLTLADFRDHVVDMNAEKAGTDNLMLNGIKLDIQMDEELEDATSNGAITYGNFTFDSEKKINLGFTGFKISSYTFNKRSMEVFNDKQSLGASGYGFKWEGFTLPTSMAKIAGGEEMGDMVPTLRLRYLEGRNGDNRSMRVTPFDGFENADNGEDSFEIRYLAQKGFELTAGNTTSYFKRA